MRRFNVDVDITMSCRIEVDAESEEQAKTIVSNWIGDDPWHHVKDGHYIKHEFEEVSECSDDPLKEYSEDYRKGIAYVKEQMDEDDKAILRAQMSKNYKQHNAPATGIDDSKIIDLLEEYGQDHDLPEGWYLDEYDADEVMLML
jgi:hypothetical protein